MPTTHAQIAPRIDALLQEVTVFPGGMTALTAGETYEEDNPSSLARTLGSVLYQTLHNGRDKPLDFAVRSFRAPAYEAQFVQRAPALQRTVQGPIAAHDGEVPLVEIDKVRLRVPEASGAVGDAVSFEMPRLRPGLSPGFLYLTGRTARLLPGPMLRLYARVEDPDLAPELWGRAVGLLEDLPMDWHGKILSSQLLYPRHDALVIYLHRDGWRQARRIAEGLQSTGLLGSGTSPFTCAITESVGCAFEPTDRRGISRGLSFGQHRANTLAQALVTHAALPDADRQPVQESVYAAFVDADIDPLEPARNLSSPATDVLGIY